MTTETWEGSPIVIVGARRSGTTLLRNMLHNHPALLVHPAEPQFFLQLHQRSGSVIDDVDGIIAYLEAHPYRAPCVTPHALREAFTGVSSLSLAEFARRYLQVWLAQDGRPGVRPVLKHPRLILHLDLVHTLFPTATVIHVVRDPRANVSSQLARWPRMTLWEAACWWRDAIRAARERVKGASLAYVEVKYEALVLDPALTLRTLCHDLRITFDRALLDFQFKSRRYAPSALPQIVSLGATDPSRVDLWRRRLSPLQVSLIESCCRREMAWYAYELLSPNVSSIRFTAHYCWQRLMWSLLRVGRSVKRTMRRMYRWLQDGIGTNVADLTNLQ